MGVWWIFWGVRSCRASSTQITTPVTPCTARITSSVPEITNLSTDVANRVPVRKNQLGAGCLLKQRQGQRKGRIEMAENEQAWETKDSVCMGGE